MIDAKSIAYQSWVRSDETAAIFEALKEDDVVRFVGGCVRNGLLGLPVLDVDMATTLLPEVVIERAEAAGLRAVPTGLDHGTVTVISGKQPYEITTLRKDVETHGRHATVAFSTDWAEDAARRDFTMNALYADRAGQVHDPLGGLEDLLAKRVLFIGNVSDRISEDYLRILRFFRIHAWYGDGALDGDGLNACIAAKDHLQSLSIERVRDEVLKLLSASNPIPVLRQMAATGVLTAILPEPLNLDRLGQLVATDTMSFFEPDGILRFGALTEGESEAAGDLGARMRLSNADQARLKAMKETEPRIVSYMSVRELRQALYRIGVQAFLDRARQLWAEDPKENNAVGWRALLAMATTWERPEFPLTGRDVMKTGVPAGPEVGRILGEVEDWWVDSDFVEDRFSLAERLKAIVQASVF